MCRCNMYATGVDSGMRCVELKQNSDVEIVSIFTMLGSSHTDFAGSVFTHVVRRDVAGCVLMLLVGITYGKAFGYVGVDHFKI